MSDHYNSSDDEGHEVDEYSDDVAGQQDIDQQPALQLSSPTVFQDGQSSASIFGYSSYEVQQAGTHEQQQLYQPGLHYLSSSTVFETGSSYGTAPPPHYDLDIDFDKINFGYLNEPTPEPGYVYSVRGQCQFREEHENSCTICYAGLESSPLIICDHCKHGFHVRCVVGWMRKEYPEETHMTCMFCRKSILVEDFLKQIPNYDPSLQGNLGYIIDQCAKCKMFFLGSAAVRVYRLFKCQHLVCRHCVGDVENNDKYCSLCGCCWKAPEVNFIYMYSEENGLQRIPNGGPLFPDADEEDE